MNRVIASIVFAAAGCLGTSAHAQDSSGDLFSQQQVKLLKSLSLSKLGPPPASAGNRHADHPEAAALGRMLFHEAGLSKNGQVACATCHSSQKFFQDNLPVSLGIGRTSRSSMPIALTAYESWFFWDGRKDSAWAQALGPWENAGEHGMDRTAIVHYIADRSSYREAYEKIFGSMPDLSDTKRFPDHAGPIDDPEAGKNWAAMSAEDQDLINRVYSNLGKAVEAFERGIYLKPSRFDRFIDAYAASGDVSLFSPKELTGLQIFLGKGSCTTCHNRPALSNGYFHNTGVRQVGSSPDVGRENGSYGAKFDLFNCLGPYSDATAPESQCQDILYIDVTSPSLRGAFKVPSLRNVSRTAPYMHAGQFKTLSEVLEHYSAAPAAAVGNSELHPLNLSQSEKDALEAFLLTLDSDLGLKY